MKIIKTRFRQVRIDEETSERRVNEAFDILFAEVIKNVQKEKLNFSFINVSSSGGGEHIYG